MPGKACSLRAHELSDCMWEVAWLKDAVPEVLQILPALATQIPGKADQLKGTRDHYICLWPAWELKDAAPELLKVVHDELAQHQPDVDLMVPNVADLMAALLQVWSEESVPEALKAQVLNAVVEEAPRAAAAMSARDFCTCMVSGSILLDLLSSRESDYDYDRLQDIVPALAAEIPRKVHCMEARELAHVLGCVADLHLAVPDVLEALPAIMAQIPGKVNEMKAANVGSCCLWAAWRLQFWAPNLLNVVAETLDVLYTFSHVGSWSRNAPAWFIDTAMDVVLPQISGLIADMEAADLAKSFVAVAELKDESPEVLQIVTLLIQRIPGMAVQKVCVTDSVRFIMKR